jgi:hypothetical protein
MSFNMSFCGALQFGEGMWIDLSCVQTLAMALAVSHHEHPRFGLGAGPDSARNPSWEHDHDHDQDQDRDQGQSQSHEQGRRKACSVRLATVLLDCVFMVAYGGMAWGVETEPGYRVYWAMHVVVCMLRIGGARCRCGQRPEHRRSDCATYLFMTTVLVVFDLLAVLALITVTEYGATFFRMAIPGVARIAAMVLDLFVIFVSWVYYHVVYRPCRRLDEPEPFDPIL